MVDDSATKRSFRVPMLTPGLKVTKLEYKMGIRASDTASLVLENCRIPLDNLLGSADVVDRTKGFKGAMATFDATRPSVAASALGIARASVELLKDLLAQEGITVRYQTPRNLLSAIERDVVDMEGQLRAAWLLTLKAAWLMDQRRASCRLAISPQAISPMTKGCVATSSFSRASTRRGAALWRWSIQTEVSTRITRGGASWAPSRGDRFRRAGPDAARSPWRSMRAILRESGPSSPGFRSSAGLLRSIARRD